MSKKVTNKLKKTSKQLTVNKKMIRVSYLQEKKNIREIGIFVPFHLFLLLYFYSFESMQLQG